MLRQGARVLLHHLLSTQCPTNEKAVAELADAKLRLVHQQVLGLGDGQLLVGADHPNRSALGEEGVLVPMQKVKNYSPGTLMLYHLRCEGHQHGKLAGQFHAAIGLPLPD